MRQLRWERLLAVHLVSVLLFGGLWLAVQDCIFEPAVAFLVSSSPNLVVEETEHDFGRVTAETDVRHEFAVRNAGRTRILLNRDICCGEDATDSHSILLPGRQLRIPITLETAGKAGGVRKVVTVRTSDPERPRIDFTLTARVAESS